AIRGSALTDVLDNFTDVSTDSEYAQAVAWAVNLGITKGTTETTFSPDKTCTRGQIVTFLYRCYGETDAA
ncbi:MAG: S-layer homology domain-containing protein, partial [Oscillibacter sp.]|nr:S-layer homology domain-containing protein [Oscillibacter sp.]